MPDRCRRAAAAASLAPEPLERRALLTVVSGFTESLFVDDLDNPTAMAFAPDGRLFVAEQGGAVRIVAPDGTLKPQPFATFDTTAQGERGVIGLALDPSFAQNGFVYVYYTVLPTGGDPLHNRVVRLTAAGDVAEAGTTVTIFDLDPLSGATNHNGGAMHFGGDGKLYVAVGDNANGPLAQSMTTTHGKMLRLNPDGSIPADNPFFATAAGDNRAIWALGLRNPFTFAVQPGSGRVFINDVGQSEREEINEGVAGANYGWPGIEGPRAGEPAPANYRDPLLSYTRDVGIAITGGVFYNPPAGAAAAFPADYAGDYFYADLGDNFVRRYDPASGQDVAFAEDIVRPVDLDVDAAGNLYVLSNLGDGLVTRISSNAVQPTPPGITASPADVTVRPGEDATFSVQANGSGTLRYQWQRDGQDIAGATGATYTLNDVSAEDDGAQIRVVVSGDGGSATSQPATLSVSTNEAPVATITAPAAGATFAAGETISYAGDATDAEDGPLPDAAFSWRVEYVTGSIVRPFLPETAGSPSGSFTISTQTPYTEVDVAYRVTLTVTDSGGATTTVSRDITPRTSTFALRSELAGVPLTLDGQPAPAGSVTGVVGLSRLLGAPETATVGGVTYVFENWSDGGAASHAVNTAEEDGVEYVATYRPLAVGGGAGLAGAYFENRDFTGRSVTRIDPALAFNFGTGSPDPALSARRYSARWTAQLEPAASEVYAFNLAAGGGGARLLLDGQPLVDQLRAKRVDQTATVELQAGRRYDLVVEFVRRGRSPAGVSLLWSSPSTPLQPVPTGNLFPPPGAGTTLLRAPTADAHTQDGKRAARSFGAGKSLLVSASGAPGSTREAYLTFDLTSLPDDLTKATLVLNGKLKGKSDAQVAAYAVDPAAWTEASLTHDTRPAADAAPVATVNVTRGAKKAYELDLTQFLLGRKAAGATSVSLALKSLTPGPAVTFVSREAGAAGPLLVVEGNG